MQPKILLLNPPGEYLYFREYYCSKISKGYYYYPPVDFIYLSGRLAGYDVTFLDCIARGLSPGRALEQIKALAPDIVMALISSPSYPEDMAFLSRLDPGITLIVTGDMARGLGGRLLEDNPFIKAAFTDFSTDDILRYLNGIRRRPNLICRDGENIVAGRETHEPGVWEVPLPRWELFLSPRYCMPFSRRRNLAVVLSDFGCAYGCTFCPMGTIPMKLRPLPDLAEEFARLRALGVRELFLQDQTFGVKKDRSLELLDIMAPHGFSFSSHSRLDVLDGDLLRALKGAGCHTLLFGVETANEKLLNEVYRKGAQPDQAEKIAQIKKAGINTCASFMIGLPGDTRDEILKTIRFACSVPLDYASFTLAAPRLGTKLREKAEGQGWVALDQLVVESAQGRPQWKGLSLSNQEIEHLHQLAIKKFFFRPWFLIHQVFMVRTAYELFNKMREWFSVVGLLFRGR
jgi:hypothetical protein